MKYEIKQSLSDRLLYYYKETFGDMWERIHFQSYSWSSLTTAEFGAEQFVLIHLKRCTSEQSSPYVLWGVFLLNPLRAKSFIFKIILF